MGGAVGTRSRKSSPFRIASRPRPIPRPSQFDETLLQGGAAGFHAGNGKKLRGTQSTPAWLWLGSSTFPVSKAAVPLCARLI